MVRGQWLASMPLPTDEGKKSNGWKSGHLWPRKRIACSGRGSEEPLFHDVPSHNINETAEGDRPGGIPNPAFKIVKRLGVR